MVRKQYRAVINLMICLYKLGVKEETCFIKGYEATYAIIKDANPEGTETSIIHESILCFRDAITVYLAQKELDEPNYEDFI